MKYKIFVRRSLSGLVIIEKDFETKEKFYEYIGRLVLKSIEHIERIDYKVLK